MKNFFKIFKILTHRQMHICALLIVLMFVVAVLEAFGIALLYPLITIIGNPGWLLEHERIAGVLNVFGINSHRKLIFFASVSLLVFYVLKNFLVILQNKLQIDFSLNNQKVYTRRLYAYYMNKPYLFHINTDVSDILRNLVASASAVFSEILINTLQIITNIILTAVIWILVFIMDPFIAVSIAFVMGPLVLFIMKYFRKKITEAGHVLFECAGKNNKFVYQGFYSLKETKVMKKEAYFIDEFALTYSDYVDSNKTFLCVQRFPKAILELFAVGGILALIAVKMIIGSDAASLIPTLGVLALAAVRLMPTLNQMISMFNAIKFKFPLFNDIYDDLMAIRDGKNFEEINGKSKSKSKLPFEHEISVKKLSFAYPEKDSDVFSDVSFSIPKGAFVGIVGPSGAGKTTFVDILLGLLSPKSGSITVDGADIADNLPGWLDNIAYVPQGIYLIDSSIKENIAFGVPEDEIDSERIETVLKMAELYDFVQTLPEKENTNVGDRGAKLSGGQKQRIGIARALYRNPNVLVLDEATSALDNETEKHISDTILKFKGKITIIAIAHRLSTLENCDFRIKFEGGSAEIIG